MQEDKTWLAAHLYYAEPWEEFLSKAVSPFVQKVFAGKLASSFFFIRYWEKGPHIRLRFKSQQGEQQQKLKAFLLKHFETYYKKNPSRYEYEKDWNKLAKQQQWYPNNSVQFIAYEPEFERYGGSVGMSISQSYFQSSSKAVLSAINETDEWNYDRALGMAIQMHLGFAHAMGMGIKKAGLFYAHVFKAWFHSAYSDDEKVTKKENIKRQKQTLKIFETNFQRQKEVLIPFHQMMWTALKKKTAFDQEWMNDWINENSLVNEKMCRLQKNKLKRWSIYESYVHMSNNRIGIMNQDEAYLGYLIKRSLESIKS